jgi:hypothetical protein
LSGKAAVPDAVHKVQSQQLQTDHSSHTAHAVSGNVSSSIKLVAIGVVAGEINKNGEISAANTGEDGASSCTVHAHVATLGHEIEPLFQSKRALSSLSGKAAVPDAVHKVQPHAAALGKVGSGKSAMSNASVRVVASKLDLPNELKYLDAGAKDIILNADFGEDDEREDDDGDMAEYDDEDGLLDEDRLHHH